MSVKVSSKYQVVIPENVRVALGIKPGTQIDVIAKGGIAFLVPIKRISDLVTTLKDKFSDKDKKNLREKKDRKL